ncbi:MAG: bifunctional phosphopantothenoylcysteine decarboxylase/phosphopantothenate--cysteine ligase CoaBC [Aquificae bacterium]|nr:bifunctional phosphopantothenoylcysteine decarboxylase/phosphopantothenate--cysteine ligase CoaBC [Aquificota bacterium]
MARVLIGTTGGIALYKVCELVRELRRRGHEVRVLMTPASESFVSPLTFETLSSNKVFTDALWRERPLAHIELARWADVFLIAPASANTIGKLAHGLADNLLTTTALAYPKPILIAPAMNTVMLRSAPVSENLKKLREMGHVIVEPEPGRLACDEEGEGKLASVERLAEWVERALEKQSLKGKRVLITCGATREYIDPVRYISNDASGLMGFSLARVFWRKGASVTLIAGSFSAQPPPEVPLVRVRTGEEMRREVLSRAKDADIIVMNAAVSDFKPKSFSPRKIKKGETLELVLVKAPDILSELGKLKGDRLLVGFALESEDLVENARKKLISKGADLIVANPVGSMGSEEHEGFLVTRDEVKPFRFGSKMESARFIVEYLESKFLGGGE